MAFEDELAWRCIAFRIDDATLRLVRSLKPEAERSVVAIFNDYYDVWRDRPGFKQFLENHQAEFIDFQSRYFVDLFDGEMGPDYVRRLGETVVREHRAGFGPRLHIGLGARLAAHLFGELGRRHRWSGPRTAEACAALLNYLTVDSLNTIGMEQVEAKRSLEERRSGLESSIQSFTGSAVEMSTTIQRATEALEDSARATASASLHARTEVDRAEAASRESAGTMADTAVATATLSRAIDEIGDQANHSLAVAEVASKDVGELERSIRELAEAVQRIGSVTGLISDVAAQTNLLALNATIEAARAGEAGRSFAVVASEVKSLADQTARATAEIGELIRAIQQATYKSVDEIAAIVQTFGDVAGSARAIVGAIHEQSVATAAIAGSAQKAASSAATVGEAAHHVRSAMTQLDSSGEAMRRRSAELAAQSSAFGGQLQAFIGGLRAG